MAEELQFTCGHIATIKPGLFGRGKARQTRLADYSKRPCVTCAQHALTVRAASLSKIVGKDAETGKCITQPYDDHDQALYVAKHLPALLASYRCTE